MRKLFLLLISAIFLLSGQICSYAAGEEKDTLIDVMMKPVKILLAPVKGGDLIDLVTKPAEELLAPVFALDEYVTPMRSAEIVSRTAASVSVITREDIENSNAQNTIDLLRNQTGIMVRDWTGNGTNASVDIRGFGEQAGMNVAVLVDGRRVNEVDLSAVDWTQIPIGQIERIEIMRGGAGAVLYGDNACAGVINIMTKSGEGEPHLKYTQKLGSYDMYASRIEVGGVTKGLSFMFTAGGKSTHGYRNNSYYKNWDFATNMEYEIDPEFKLKFRQGWHKAEYGLPGAISSTNMERHNRRYSDFGEDYAKNTDYNFVGGIEKGLWGWGDLSCDFSFRRKYVYSNFIGANGGWNPITRATIDTYSITPKYVLDKQIFEHDNKLVTGVDYYRAENDSDVYNAAHTIQGITAINKNTVAWYGQDTFSILPTLSVVGGFRYEQVKYDLDYRDLAVFFANPTIDNVEHKIGRAYNVGVIYEYMKNSQIFFTHNQSFRFPATDEYIVWGVLNPKLKEQVSRNYEVGIRQAITDFIRIDVTGFWMNLKDELFYNPLGGAAGTGSNENYGKTSHQGLEVSAEVDVNEDIELFGNYSFTQAKFVDGTYDGKYIPMVPKGKGSLGLRIFFLEHFTFNFIGAFVGERYFINDQRNRYPTLKKYFTADVNLFYERGDLRIGGGISNILNEKYYEYGVCNANTGAVNYYPAAGINSFLEASYKF